MKYAPVPTPVRILAFSLALVMVTVVGEAFAGEGRGGRGIPPRVPKIKDGDWVLYRDDDGFRKETATGSEKADKEYMVFYTIEEFDEKGKAKGKPQEVARFQDDENAENAEFLAGMKGAKVERRKVQIDGKNVTVLVYITTDPDDNSKTEYWYTDEFSIDGKVAMRVIFESEESYTVFETVGFGDAKAKFDIKKYID